MYLVTSPAPEVCIAGAGIIGLSLALELYRRGCCVTILDQGDPLGEASTAAAGMLAAADPDNPPPLRPLADLSLSRYPDFLDHIHDLSGIRVPFQTHTALQSVTEHSPILSTVLTQEDLVHLLPALTPSHHRFVLLDEHSLDPRQLASALLAAVRATTIDLRSHTPVLSVHRTDSSIEIRTPGSTFDAAQFVDCTGAWASGTSRLRNLQVTAKKGQMFSASLPASFPLHFVLRTPEIYIVPRTAGPAAGCAIVGATVEDAGFNKTVHPNDIAHLRSLAAALLPPLANAPQLEAWAGLRPVTCDGLPLLGLLPDRPNYFIASGHYRNGILLAPATACVMAQILSGEAPSVDLAAFSPTRAKAI